MVADPALDMARVRRLLSSINFDAVETETVDVERGRTPQRRRTFGVRDFEDTT
jgi:hypothetical protein